MKRLFTRNLWNFLAELLILCFLVMNSIAIEQTRFVIQGTPKKQGEPFTFKGRTMVTYVRYEGSTTGWATIREIIQPATQ